MKIRNLHISGVAAALMLVLGMTVLSGCSDGSLPDDYAYDDLSKYIKLGEYKGIEYTKADVSVSDSEVKAEIDKTLEEKAETVKVESGTVKKDSVVNIDYVGSIDGKEFEGGKAEGADLDIANSGYIDGFAEGIVGHKVGETFDLHVTFPENYGKDELNGKPAVFKTTINYISEKKVPEYTDKWVKDNTDYSDKTEYEKSIKDELRAQKESQAESSEKNEVFTKISDASEVIEYPEKELTARKDQIVESYETMAKNSGAELDDYLSQSMGMDRESFDKEVDAAAENAVKGELILHSIADAEGISLSGDDYNSYLDGLLEQSGYTRDSFKEQRGMSFEEYASENNLYMSYMYETVMTKVMEYSKAK